MAMAPVGWWRSAFPALKYGAASQPAAGGEYHLHPHYRAERPLELVLQKVQPGLDDFITEKYAEQIAAILADWSLGLLRSAKDSQSIAKALAADFTGASVRPTESNLVRESSAFHVRRNKFTQQIALSREAFLNEWRSSLNDFAEVVTAEFQVTAIDAA